MVVSDFEIYCTHLVFVINMCWF